MKYITPLIVTLLLAACVGCVSIARTDTARDQSFGDPIAKVADNSLTPEQAKGLQGKTLNGPEVTLFGGNLKLGLFRYAKGLVDQYDGSEFSHGSAGASKSAAAGIRSHTKHRHGKEHTFGVEDIASEAQTKEFLGGVTDIGRVWLASTPAGQVLLAKSSVGDVITKSDLDTVLTDPGIPANVKSELEGLKSSAP